MNMSLLSVVLPAYNEDQMICKAASVISDVLYTAAINFELIFVDDGSIDKTWRAIQELSESNANVKGIHFSRNFGKESAIIAGLQSASGNCCVVIDCDLQHPPQTIVKMFRLWEQGYEIVEGQKSSRGSESISHSFAARTFYTIISTATGIDMRNASDFKLLDRKAVDALVSMRERNSFFRALSSWIGFETTTVVFEVQEREAGESKWSTWSLVKYALNNIASFSTAPMQIVTILGIIMLLVSVVFGITALVQRIIGIAQPGFTTVILIMIFASSITMISLGIIGFYIARIYEEIKGRPKYIVSATCGELRYRNDAETF